MGIQRLTALGLLVLAMGPVLAAQAPQQTPTFQAGVDLIEVDVGVVDGDGRPIADLDASDFSVSIDGEPRRIVQAQFISLGAPTSDIDRPVSEDVEEEAFHTSNVDQPEGRLVVMAVDEDSMLFGEGRHVTRAAGAFVDGLGPADRVSLLAVPQPGVYIDFTSDHARVRQALEGLAGQGSHPSIFVNLSVWEAYQIVVYQDEAVQSAVGTRECGGDRTCPPLLELEANRIVMETRYRTRNTIRALESILEALRELDGPKSVVLITGGLVIDQSPSMLREVGKLAAAARTTLYVMMVDEPLIDMSRVTQNPTASADRLMKEEGLQVAAALARGRLIRAHYNPAPLFARIDRELSGYYLLGVESRPADRDKDRRGIKVSVERRGARVRARRDVFFSSEDEDRAVDDVDARIAHMLRSPVATQDLPLRVATYAYGAPQDDETRVFVSAETVAVEGGIPELTLGYAVRDAAGAVVRQENRQVTPRLTQTPDGPVLETSLTLRLEPGIYSLRLAVVDDAGRPGSVEHSVDTTPQDAGPLAVGDLVATDPDTAQAGGMFPPVEARVSGGRVRAFTELYGDASLLRDRAKVHLEVTDRIAGPTLALTTVLVNDTLDTPHRVITADLGVANLPPGRYLVRARVMHDTVEVTRLHRPFWIDTPQAVADRDGQPR